MVERVSNVALQWRLMNFFREFSQPKKHIPLSLSLSLNESFFGVWPPSSCPLGPMSTPDKLLTSSSRSPFLFNILSGSNQKPQIRDLLLFSFFKKYLFLFIYFTVFSFVLLLLFINVVDVIFFCCYSSGFSFGFTQFFI